MLVALLASVALLVGQPYGIVPRSDGSMLVADFTHGAVVRIAPGGRATLVARVPAPRDLRALPDGRLLVSSGRRVLVLDLRTGRTRVSAVARAPLEGIAPAGGARIDAVEGQSRIVRFSADGRRTVLATGLNGVHGILATPAGLVVCEAYAGRVRLLVGRRLRTLAAGLGNPSYAAAVAGGVYVTEFTANRVSRLLPTGAVRRVATVFEPGPIAPAADGTLLVGSLDGSITRVDPRTGASRRVYPR